MDALRTKREIMADFAQPIPEKYICRKTIKNATIDYVSVHHYEYLLDKFVGAGNWRWEVRDTSTMPLKGGGCKLVVTIRLHIKTSDCGWLWQDEQGVEGEVSSYGDETSNASAQAKRRACRAFGLGRHLWTDNPDEDNLPEHPNEVKIWAVLEEYGLSDLEGILSDYLPKGRDLASLQPEQVAALVSVLKAELHPTLGEAYKRVFSALGLQKVVDRANYLKSLRLPKDPGIDDVLGLIQTPA